MSRVYQINLSNEPASDQPVSFDELQPSNWAFKKRFMKKFMSNGKCACNVYKIGVSLLVSVLVIVGIVALIVLAALGKFPGPKPVVNAKVAIPANFSIEIASGETCGASRSAQLAPEPRIIGGTTAAENSLPWIVSLRLNQFEKISSHFCAGSIITSQHILTAAHCVVNNSPSDIIVLAGIYDVDAFTRRNVFYVQSVTINQEYGNGVVNDIAILRLARSLPFSDTISPICLTSYDANVLGGQLLVAGWGKFGNGFSTLLPRYLQQIELNIINDQPICAAMSPYWNSDMMLCALDLVSGQSGNACLGWSHYPPFCLPL